MNVENVVFSLWERVNVENVGKYVRGIISIGTGPFPVRIITIDQLIHIS